jgi:hypothetical protein
LTDFEKSLSLIEGSEGRIYRQQELRREIGIPKGVSRRTFQDFFIGEISASSVLEQFFVRGNSRRNEMDQERIMGNSVED